MIVARDATLYLAQAVNGELPSTSSLSLAASDPPGRLTGSNEFPVVGASLVPQTGTTNQKGRDIVGEPGREADNGSPGFEHVYAGTPKRLAVDRRRLGAGCREPAGLAWGGQSRKGV